MTRMARTLQADPKASEELLADTVRKEQKSLLRFIRKRVGSDEDAEDILQEVWYQLVSTLRSEPIDQVVSWLYRVARNRVIDWYRRKRPVSNGLPWVEEDPGYPEPFPWIQEPEDTSGDPLSRLYLEEFWELLQEALLELPSQQRNVFIQHELEGKKFRDIEARTGVGVNTLQSRNRYAQRYLKRRLNGFYEEFLED